MFQRNFFSSILAVLFCSSMPATSYWGLPNVTRSLNYWTSFMVFLYRCTDHEHIVNDTFSKSGCNEKTAGENPSGSELGGKLYPPITSFQYLQFEISFKGGLFIFWCYGTKFLPTVLVVLSCFVGVLTKHCEEICTVLPNCTCAFFYNPVILTESISMGGWDENLWTLLVARLIVSFIIILHFGKWLSFGIFIIFDISHLPVLPSLIVLYLGHFMSNNNTNFITS